MAAMTATFTSTTVRHVCGSKCACRGWGARTPRRNQAKAPFRAPVRWATWRPALGQVMPVLFAIAVRRAEA